ncbi:ATP-grasp domain-containing protein [Bacillus fonticola]|uniref:ATP-grasp domain-containing protein n=1 Tax=Bacillus fonticola TaxID=2728853 RepID=UPI001472AA6D|nr:ATP-grasp domain-containing protein [Bacillus fonticola]
MKKRRVLIIADTWEYIKYYLKDKLNLEVILFQDPNRKHLVKEGIADEVHLFSLENTNYAISLAKQINLSSPIEAVWSFTDEGVELATIIAEKLSLPSNTLISSRYVNDKSKLRNLLNQNNISKVEFIETNSKKEVERFFLNLNKPIIMKPKNGSGSQNIFKISKREDIDAAFSKIIDKHKVVLVEEYLDGREISVESMTYNGNHFPIQITDKEISSTHIEIGHVMPASVSVGEENEIRQLVKNVLTLINHQFGPTHIEIKLTSSGPKIVEAHTRPGGDFIVMMLADVFGLDLITLTIEYLLDNKMQQITLNTGKAAAVRYFESEKLGVIRNISGMEELMSHPNVLIVDLNYSEGDNLVQPINSFTRPGCLVVFGSTNDEVKKLSMELAGDLVFITE